MQWGGPGVGYCSPQLGVVEDAQPPARPGTEVGSLIIDLEAID